jgi:hypothetical protein
LIYKIPKVAVVVKLPPPNIGTLVYPFVVAGNAIAVIAPVVNVHVVV